VRVFQPGTLRSILTIRRSMTAYHPYATSREASLALFSKPAQQRRNLADAKSPELFVLLHGMLFTNIQLDDFHPTLARYLERLQLDGAQEREWIMMAVVNIAAILQYGKNEALIKPASATAAGESSGNTMAGKKRELVLKMDSLAVTDSPTTPSPTMDLDSPPETDMMALDIPIQLQYALQLAFSTLSFCLRHPLRRSSQFARPTLNPYITILLTFVTTILKQPGVLPILERSFPWDDLITFLRTSSRRQLQKEVDSQAKLTSGCAPLPEDWCLRGMGWVGRRVYEHGFWPRGASSSSGVTSEMDVLVASENAEQETDGIIEDDEHGEDVMQKDFTGRRWVRIIRSCLGLTQIVPGFEIQRDSEGTRFDLGEAMMRKAELWKEEERREREEDERRRNRHWDDEDDMDVDVDYEEEEEELDDDPTVRALQV
jgi:protein SMG6